MLNELHRLAESLKAAELQPPRKHPRVKEPGPSSGPCLRLSLDDQGRITSLDRVTKEEWPGLWTVREGNQNAFPVCRLPIDPDAASWPKAACDLFDRLEKKAEELEGASRSDGGLANVNGLCARFVSMTHDRAEAYQQLIARLPADDDQRLRAELQKLRAAGKKGFPAIQLAFDHDRETIYRTSTRGLVERALPLGDGEGPPHSAQECAYSGTSGHLQAGPFPAVMLPVLNKAVPLVSMFSDDENRGGAPCNHRYGLADSSIVPVSTDVALKMQDALAFIVTDERKGLTWCGIWNGHFEKSSGHPREQRDLLIAYVEGGVILPAPIASLFGTGTGGELAQFEADASAVCAALDGVARQAPESRLNIFLLRRVSEGQAQVQLSAQPAVRDIISAAESWQRGGKNIPAVSVRVPASKGSGQVLLRPLTPRPDRLVSITSRQWMESGKRWSSSQGANFSQVLNVMLKGPGWETAATALLGLTVSRTWPLMTGLFGVLLRLRPANSARHGYPLESCRDAMLATTVLGILLHALDHRKEEYMHSAPFLVGRLLALADVLHREHSLQGRKAQQLPPQMIGNALMAVARDNPTAAVARLSERLPLYKSWAEREGDRLARWAVGRIQITATQLASATLPASANEADRAQLILGYVSRLSDSVSGEEGEGESSGGQDE